ncbi:response regulator [Sulfurimonas xiamenensis]|uniref:Response regulator n=1 Tax=Sulfurimonas xiamenensis TaxID=2590021 RepID=A0AAJ4A358_9BACT|nr:response regulator [Sulfurimonas xiamenensis]
MQLLINEYFLKITALITAVTLLIIYFIFKILYKKNTSDSLDKQSIEVKTSSKTEDDIIEPENRKKRELIPHSKITKENFSLFKNVKILIAEDNIINQKVITSILSNSGIDITIANNGQEALNILEKESDFSIIFMDAHMPVMDGYQATRMIRKNQNYNHIPIIALSGDTAPEDIKNMLNAGMEAHLEKPIKMDAIYDVLYIYTTGEEEQNNSYKSQKVNLKLDTEKGLEICGDDKNFYLEILNDFISSYCDSADKLQKYINDKNKTDADKMLLDISGVSANIGANNLHDRALDLKKSITNPTDDLKYINDLKKYSRSLHQVCEAIEKYKNNN